MKKTLALIGLVIFAVLMLGCGGSGSPTAVGGNGTLSVHMADAPDPTITSVVIHIDKVEAHVGSGWQTVSNTTQIVDLLDLVQNDIVIGQALVPAGKYTQIRLMVSSGTVTDATGTHNLVIPSAIKTGIKINLNFTVDPNVLTEILLDFNVDKSIVKLGNGIYHLKPVIPAVIKIVSGTITGTVTDGTNPLSGASITATYTAGTSYPIGTIVNTTSSLSDGTFKIWALKAGTYRLDFTWTDPIDPKVILTGTVNANVIANQDTAVGTVVLK